MTVSQSNIDRVLFVAGAGRSGSTLLEILLGQIDGFYSTGELRFIWKRSFGQNQLCGCGKPFNECEFWTEVVKEAFGGYQNVDHERLESLRRAAEHYFSEKPLDNSAHNDFASYEEYISAYREIYRAIRKISGCDFIIDSSKNVAHGFVLAAIPGIDLFTLHLMRDSRAVAYSWQRERLRPEVHWEQRFMGKRGILNSATRWNSLNTQADKLRLASKQFALLRYEDFVCDPKDSLSKMLADLEIKQFSLDFLNGTRATLKPVHTVSGNPVRFMRNEIEIKPDMQWQHNIANFHKWLVTLLTWPLLLKYGYLGNGHSKEKLGE